MIDYNEPYTLDEKIDILTSEQLVKGKELFIRLFEDLKKKKMLNKERNLHELNFLNFLIRQSSIYDSGMKFLKKQMGFNKDQGLKWFDENKVDEFYYMYLTFRIARYNYNIELIRNILLFMIKHKEVDYNTTWSRLLCTLKKYSPEPSEELESLIGVPIRNAISHGRYWIWEKGVCVIIDKKLEQMHYITPFSKFVTFTGHVTILCYCCIDVIGKYYLPKIKNIQKPSTV